MRNFKVMMSYDGAAYHGFQRQENALAIQQVVEEKIAKLIGEKVTIYGCSRTDTGVHANEFCFNFKHDISITCNGFVRALNGLLPGDISAYSCEEADDSFHARFDCKGKEYVYKIHNSYIKNPFYKDRVLQYFYSIDDKLLNEAAQHFVGTHDFKAFCSIGSTAVNTVRTIEYFNVVRENDLILMLVKGDGFLYNMVRIMVGTLIFVGEGKIKSNQIGDIILSGERKNAGKTAPAQGLYLNKVFYDV